MIGRPTINQYLGIIEPVKVEKVKKVRKVIENRKKADWLNFDKQKSLTLDLINNCKEVTKNQIDKSIYRIGYKVINRVAILKQLSNEGKIKIEGENVFII